MKKKWLVKTLALGIVVLFIGFAIQPGKSTNTIQDEKTGVDAKDYLFQTILDIVNDREVQSVVSKYHSGMFHRDMQTRVLTMKQLNSMYLVGSIFSKRVDKLKVQSLFQNYKLNNQELLNEIGSIIENNVTLNMKMEQLEMLNCGCVANEPINGIFPPVICAILWMIGIIPFALWLVTVILTHVGLEIMYLIWTTIVKIGQILNCPGFY